MKIAILGCGAMGSVYAARLGDAAHEVLVVDAWAEHMSAVNERGLRLEGPDGSRTVRLRAFTTPPAEPVDLVVLAVKAADVGTAASSIQPLLRADTAVLTIQNGLGSADDVADAVGADRLAVGVASGFGASLRGPAMAHHNAMRAIRIGAYGALDPSRVAEVAAAWRQGGFDTESVSDIAAMQWEKLMCNVAYSAPCALTGLTIGEVMDDDLMGPVSRSAASEAWQVARARGVAIKVEDPVSFVRDFGAAMPAAKPSALLDHEAHRVSEIVAINGAVPREASKVGLEAPVNATLTALALTREAAWRR